MRMLPLVRSDSAFEAKVLAARLGAEGIVWELRGAVDGVYPVGAFDVLVAEEDMPRARELLLADMPESAYDGGETSEPTRLFEIVAATTLVLVAGVFLLTRLLAF